MPAVGLLAARGSATVQPKGPVPYHPWGAPPVAVYRTAAINLTSHLRLVLDEGVQLRGTEDFAANCGGTNRSTCDDLDSPWPVLPNAVYPSRQNSAGDDAGPVKQAFIRGYNLTDITIRGAGAHTGVSEWRHRPLIPLSTRPPGLTRRAGARAW